MHQDPRLPAICPDGAPHPEARTEPPSLVPGVDWLGAIADLDECDGYVVLAVDPQTGEVDAHGPFGGVTAVHAAEDLRTTLDREELGDVVVRIVRWHTSAAA